MAMVVDMWFLLWIYLEEIPYTVISSLLKNEQWACSCSTLSAEEVMTQISLSLGDKCVLHVDQLSLIMCNYNIFVNNVDFAKCLNEWTSVSTVWSLSLVCDIIILLFYIYFMCLGALSRYSQLIGLWLYPFPIPLPFIFQFMHKIYKVNAYGEGYACLLICVHIWCSQLLRGFLLNLMLRRLQ
jgi:hypothetical protein